MKFFLWLIIGFICTGVPFFALYHSYDLWPSVIGGIVGGTIFFILLFVFVIRKKLSLKEQILVGGAQFVFIIAFIAYSFMMYSTTSYQRKILGIIRTRIGSSIIIENEIYRKAVPVLRSYYNQPQHATQKSIVEIFNSLYGKEIKNGLFVPDTLNFAFRSPTWTFVKYSGDSLIKFVSIDSVANGLKSEFKGITGQTGKIQFTAMITKEGVQYERNN